jgi:1-pyrroline-5-carboxylate dehydrogenase
MGAGNGRAAAPAPVNEPERAYASGTPERAAMLSALADVAGERPELPLVIGGRRLRTGETQPAVMPHRTGHVLADVQQADGAHVNLAIEAAMAAWAEWHRWPWTERAAVFLRAAALASGPWRERLVAATMLGQSKTLREADADICELADFFRFNVSMMQRIYDEQPTSTTQAWNRVDYRPLEGFVFAATPFNFTAIGGNLPSSCALMGNTVVWKPAASATLSAYYVMLVLEEAGLPPGVINLVFGDPAEVSEAVLDDRRLAGIHFTGSTAVFRSLWQGLAQRLDRYTSFPRLVGETGGKDFIVAHPSADVDQVLSAIISSSFEYQGQKCSAASRLYMPASLWRELGPRLAEETRGLRMGDVADLDTFMGAVISQRSFDTQQAAIAEARADAGSRVLVGGGTDASTGYFVEPTVVEIDDPASRLLRDELFGPITAAHVYPDDGFTEVLEAIDGATPYALTGSVFARDQGALTQAQQRLEYAAGNLYVNDKPTGAIVGQQPFGGSRASGTNDKTGSIWNLARWVTPRTIKENWLPASQPSYPHTG